MQTSLKICFTEISLDAQKILVAQILRGLQQTPPQHPRLMRLGAGEVFAVRGSEQEALVREMSLLAMVWVVCIPRSKPPL